MDDGTRESAGPRQARTLLYLRSLAIPSEAMLIGNLQAEMPPIEERLATAMGSGPLFLGDLRKLTRQSRIGMARRFDGSRHFGRKSPSRKGSFRSATGRSRERQPGMVSRASAARAKA